MKKLKIWVAAILLVWMFGSQFNELRFRRHSSPRDWDAWIQLRDSVMPASNGRNVA